MEFEVHREGITLYDARGRAIESWVEVRFHPVTGEISRIINVPIRKLILPDLKKMAGETRANCPFCPSQLGENTPKFDDSILKEGVLRRGRAVLIPNRFPYDRYCALIILSDNHYIPLDALEETSIADGLLIAQEFLTHIAETDDSTQAFSLNWNYAPHSGSSILHPHIQLSAGAFATNRARRLMDSSHEAMLKGRDIMAEWLHAEREVGQRWCGKIGPWHISLAFAPRGRFFEINILHGSKGRFIPLENEDIRDLARGIALSFRFITAMGFVSMNLSLFSPLREDGWFHPMVSISPRACAGPYQISDISFQMLIDEFFAIFLPEEVSERLRNTWERLSNPTKGDREPT